MRARFCALLMKIVGAAIAGDEIRRKRDRRREKERSSGRESRGKKERSGRKEQGKKKESRKKEREEGGRMGNMIQIFLSAAEAEADKGAGGVVIGALAVVAAAALTAYFSGRNRMKKETRSFTEDDRQAALLIRELGEIINDTDSKIK